MKAARLHEYHQSLKVEEIDEPKIAGPFDVIVKIGAAGLWTMQQHDRGARRPEVRQTLGERFARERILPRSLDERRSLLGNEELRDPSNRIDEWRPRRRHCGRGALLR